MSSHSKEIQELLYVCGNINCENTIEFNPLYHDKHIDHIYGVLSVAPTSHTDMYFLVSSCDLVIVI